MILVFVPRPLARSAVSSKSFIFSSLSYKARRSYYLLPLTTGFFNYLYVYRCYAAILRWNLVEFMRSGLTGRPTTCSIAWKTGSQGSVDKLLSEIAAGSPRSDFQRLWHPPLPFKPSDLAQVSAAIFDGLSRRGFEVSIHLRGWWKPLALRRSEVGRCGRLRDHEPIACRKPKGALFSRLQVGNCTFRPNRKRTRKGHGAPALSWNLPA